MEPNRNLFQDLPPEERAKTLKDNCCKIEETLVTRPFTHDELKEYESNLAKKSVELQVEKIKFDKLKKEHELKTKPMIESISETTKSLRLRYSETMEDVVLMDNHETGMMESYDMDGIFLNERPLRPSERQMSIASKTGTHEG